MKKKQIIIVGNSRPNNEDSKVFYESLYNLGVHLAKSGYTIIYGACSGYPDIVAKGAFQSNGLVVGFSPGRNFIEHIKKYRSPYKYCSILIYTKSGLMQREIDLMNQGDLVLVVDGNIGTLTEIGIAIKDEKSIFIVKDFIRFDEILNTIIEKLDIYPNPKVTFTNFKEITSLII